VRAKTSEERLKIYSDGLVPQSEATFQSALSAYQSNRQDFESLLSGFLDVLNLDLEDPYRIGVRSSADPPGIGSFLTKQSTPDHISGVRMSNWHSNPR
jgi:hypothetical protein